MKEERPKVVDHESNKQLYPSNSVKQRMREDYSHLKGKTLEVYYLLVENQGEQFGVREVQRTLDYSSPSIASYHLNRLEENELVKSTKAGKYYVDQDPIKLGKLEDHIQVAGVMLPKILFYAYHAILSVIVAGILFVTRSRMLVWFVFFVSSNIVFLVIILRDAKKVSNKLRQQ